MGAVQHFQAGHDSQAETLCRQVLAAMPDNPDALLLLGMILGRTGRYAEAVPALERCVARAPANPAAHLNLGRALAALGRTDDAHAAYGRALRIEPGLAEAHYSLGNLNRETKDLDGAAAAYRRAVELQPAFAAAWDNLGNVLQELERHDEALDAYEKVLALDPSSASAHNNFGTLMQRRGYYDRAVEAFETALGLDGNFVDAWINLGRVLGESNEPERAETAFKRALDTAPDSAETLGELAQLYEFTNRVEEALEMAHRGIAVDPGDAVCNLVAAMCDRRSGRIDEGIRRLESLVATLEPAKSYRMRFELGALYDRVGDTGKAFEHYEEANRLYRSAGGGYAENKQRYLRKVATLRAAFTPDWVRSWSQSPPETRPSPVYLVGFPRSGTTILEQIIDAHPRLAAIDERRTLEVVTEDVTAMDAGYPGALADLSADTMDDLRAAYFAAADQYAEQPPDGLIVDKLPLNITDAGLIHRLFPSARFIVAVRHPCDACLSAFMQYFTINDAMANTFTIDDTAALYAEVMSLWRQYVDVLPLAWHRIRLPLAWHRIRYEDLVYDVEGQVRGLFEFLGVGWDDAVLAYTDHAQNRGRIFTPSYQQVSQPIYTRSRYRWRAYERELEPVMAVLRPWIEYYGYDAD